jgi:hypothetical protein
MEVMRRGAPKGGYDLEGLARSVAAHVTALMEG